MKVLNLKLVALFFFFSSLFNNSFAQVNQTDPGNGATLVIYNADNAANVYLSVDGGPETLIFSGKYRDNDPGINDVINIIPPTGGKFSAIYTVRIELRNELSIDHDNPMHILAALYSVGGGNLFVTSLNNCRMIEKISEKTAGSGFSGAVRNYIMRVQKM